MNTNSNEVLENLGFIIGLIVLFCILCIPGAVIYHHNKTNLRKEVINELCNASNGKYEFCELENTVFTYKEVKLNEVKERLE